MRTPTRVLSPLCIALSLAVCAVACSETEDAIGTAVAAEQHPEESDAVVLHTMKEQFGADLSKPTPIQHYLTFADEAEARRAADELGPDFETDVAPVSDQAASLRVSYTDVPTLANIRRVRLELTTLAQRHGGSYGAWEAKITR